MQTFNFKRKIYLLAISCLVLTACQSTVRTDISTFRDEGIALGQGTISIIPDSEDTHETLEFRFFKDKLAQRLGALGFKLLADDSEQPSEYVARLGYGVSRQEKDKPDSRVFVGGHLGYGYGHYPHSSVLISNGGDEFEYTRELSIAIDRRAESKLQQILQIKASSLGSCEHMTVVYDEMLDAVFANLMRADGSIEHLKVKGDVRCP